jgi:hypothetical protein
MNFLQLDYFLQNAVMLGLKTPGAEINLQFGDYFVGTCFDVGAQDIIQSISTQFMPKYRIYKSCGHLLCRI